MLRLPGGAELVRTGDTTHTMSTPTLPRAQRTRRISLLLAATALLPTVASAQQSAARVWNEQIMAAIRINLPNPPGHARNLFHTATAMYDAWAAYDPTAVGYIYNEKAVPPDWEWEIEAARAEAISYAAYRVIWKRFVDVTPAPVGAATTYTKIKEKMTQMGYSYTTAEAAITNGTSNAELGKRIAQAILTWGSVDGWGNSAYPQAYTTAVNPNFTSTLAINVKGVNLNFEPGMPLGFGIPTGTNPNFWQPLALDSSVSQNGIPEPGGVQGFVGVQGLTTTPFSLTRSDPTKPWIDPGPPSRLSMPGQPSATDAQYKEQAMGVLRYSSRLNDDTVQDYSPKAIGNNPLGSDGGTGYTINPATNQPYASNPGKVSDFQRVIAEYWADGPNSETPPGHWHVLANEIADNPALVKKIKGQGLTVNNLEWDVKAYFAVATATHDAACACWSIKRYYNGQRPITMIRYMGSLGQSSNPADATSYHPEGLPLEAGVTEVVTQASIDSGRHAIIWDVAYNSDTPGSLHLGKVVIRSWPGEHPANLPAPSVADNQSMVKWMLAKDWLPFQRKTFNTPAFPGYTSGHSTFSRAAAEALTLLTGSPYFPGGFHHHVIGANSMQIDKGPSVPVDLQWATYYDAGDQAGQSRRWGGIHPSEDDYNGRIVGSQVGKMAFALAEKYWNGTINEEAMAPQVTMVAGGGVKLSWKATRGMYHKVQASTNLTGWTDVAPYSLSYGNGSLPGDTTGVWTDTNPPPGQRFYRILRSTSP